MANVHFLLKCDESFRKSLLSSADELATEEFDDAWRVDKRSSSVSNCSMISCISLIDLNPTFGLHPNMVEYHVQHNVT